MTFVEFLNNLIVKKINSQKKIVIYGQNINAGSCLSGLTKNINFNKQNLVINSQNSENSLAGFGFGLMLKGISSIFFMKQLDFLLLSIDQIVNTYNIIRMSEPSASFTIFPITVDSGFEGPQSSLNNLDDFCSIAGVEGFSVTNSVDATYIINNYLSSPGFRILTVGQKSLKKEIIDLDLVHYDEKYNFFHYKYGKDVTIITFNQSLNYGLELMRKFELEGISTSFFSYNAHQMTNLSYIFKDLNNTKNLILIDDSKSKSKVSDVFMKRILQDLDLKSNYHIIRNEKDILFQPNEDDMKIDYDYYVKQIKRMV